MLSPIKNKNKKRDPPESKKKQLLSVFHQTIPFLQIFTPEEIDSLEDRLHIFVFSRGQTLAKQMEYIDYIGVIVEGRAISKDRNYQIGDTIGHLQILGYRQKHPQSITGESDGIIIAIRIYDLVSLPKPSLGNKIVAYVAELYASDLLKRQDLNRQISQFQTIEEKKVFKYLTPDWSTFLKDLDLKEKNKFNSYFPFYSVKQKDLLMNSTLKPSLLYVVSGQIIIKTKLQQKIIQSGNMLNEQGFFLNQQVQQNIYCLSADAVILMIDKQKLQSNFKASTFNSIIKIVLKNFDSKYKQYQEKKQNKEVKEVDIWSIFKKNPEREIVSLPKKVTQSKTIKPMPGKDTQSVSIIAFQTLFKEQLGSAEGKVKTISSVADSNYERLYSLKTEPQGKQSVSEGQLQKLRKQVDILTEKLKFSEEMNRETKLNFIENKSRLAMNELLKSIRKLHQEEQTIHKVKVTEGQASESLLTFKQAFDKQIKQNRIQQVVAKCAFKWLYLTRKRKVNKTV